MSTVKIQLRYDNNRIQQAQAASVKVEDGMLVLRGEQGNETGRFNMDKVENWWIEPDMPEIVQS